MRPLPLLAAACLLAAAGSLLACSGCRAGRPVGEARAGGEAHAEGDGGGHVSQEEWFAGLLRVEAGAVAVLVDGGGGDTEELVTGLAAAVEAMAPRVPVDLEVPVTVAVERDHVEQIRHAGAVGEAVPGDGGATADVHLVHHPRDGFAYRHALARELLEGAGLGDLPPYLREGAALWLSGAAGTGTEAAAGPGPARKAPAGEQIGEEGEAAGAAARPTQAPNRPAGERLGEEGGDAPAAGTGAWYGLPWRDWLAPLAAADVLPTVDELLAAEELPDGSRLLWTPVAAAVVESLPGDTAAAKLERPPAALREAAAALLVRLEAEGAASRRPAAGASPADRRASEPTAPLAEGFAPTRDPLPPFLSGVSLAMLNDHGLGYQAPSVDRALVRLRRDVAADAVALMPFVYQEHPHRPAMRYLNRRPGSETDAAMIHAGRRAEERGFVVLWKPQIWLRGSWPGEIAMTTEADWDAWFRGYRRFVVHQAVLARWTGAELFAVGVELGRTVEREDDWRRLVAAVRRVYDGPLTYAANWHGDFDRVPFWDALDLLGIDAYEPLSDDPSATPRQLRAGARRVVAGLAAGARRHGKPLLLTELGYAAHEAAWVAPHEEGGPLSEPDQAAAYRAFLTALGRPPWLRGVFVWKAFSNAAEPGGEGRHSDRADFRFLDREAASVIHDYYTAP